MTRKTGSAVLIAVFTTILLAGAQTAAADPVVAAGDTITFADRPGSPGGEFLAVVNNAWSFVTFCLQKTEYIDFTNTFVVEAVSTYATSDPASVGGDGSGHDPLDQRTAWLYTQFTNGTLEGYAYTGTTAQRTSSANLLQNAIWMIEQEIAMNVSQYYVKLANDAVAAGWSGIGDVRALNLVRQLADGTWVEAQDQLTRVPEPATLLLLGLGWAGIALPRSRIRRLSSASIRA